MARNTWFSFNALLVLRALLERDQQETWGLEIINDTGMLSGTVYPILGRLKRDGIIKSRKERLDPRKLKRPARTYYQLTPKGRKISIQTLSVLQMRLPAA